MNPRQRRRDCLELPPVTQERRVEVPLPQVVENVIEVPHVQHIERFEESIAPDLVTRWVPTPKVDVTERVVEIPKPVIEEKVVEIPQVEIVEKVVEVPQYVYKEKLVEIPRVVLQERVIPVPKRVIEEKVIEVPESEFNEILRRELVLEGDEHHHPPSVSIDPRDAPPEPPPPPPPAFVEQPHPMFFQPSGPAAVPVGYVTPPVFDVGQAGSGAAHCVAGFGQVPPGLPPPLYRHVPRYVEVPIPHYRPVPVERVVDKAVPVPVEEHVEEQFLCPKVEPKYINVPVDVPYGLAGLHPSILVDASSRQYPTAWMTRGGGVLPPLAGTSYPTIQQVFPVGPFPITPVRFAPNRRQKQKSCCLLD